MLNKYPEIWLRESVMLIDLQTSSIFSLPPFLFFSGPVSPYKRARVQRRETGLRHLNQLLLINLHSQEKNALTCTHTQICLDAENLVRSEIFLHGSFVILTTQDHFDKRMLTVNMQDYFFFFHSIAHKMSIDL